MPEIEPQFSSPWPVTIPTELFQLLISLSRNYYEILHGPDT
jgi:hypothetical protein